MGKDLHLSKDIQDWIDANIIASWATKSPKNKHYLAEWENFMQQAQALEEEVRHHRADHHPKEDEE
jgi:hypothetical protein